MPYNVTVDDISPLITYTGQWVDAFNSTLDSSTDRYLGRTFHASEVNGDQAMFQFNGTAVYIFGAKRGNHGNYSVQIDNEQPRVFSGFADGTDELFQEPIYVRTDLSNGLHKVILTNNGQPNLPYVDIDFVTWTSNDESYANKTLDDGRFEYSPPDAWWNTSPYVDDYYGRTVHVTNRAGASASLTFNGTGIYLYGGTLEDHSVFAVELDDHPAVLLNGSTKGYHSRVPLYYADGLGPGTHKLTVTHTENYKYLDIDYVDIVQPPPSSSTSSSRGKNNVPIIIGVVCGVVTVLAVAALAIWYLRRRRKQRSQAVDLMSEEIKPYGDTPLARHGTSHDVRWGDPSALQYNDPWTGNTTPTSTYTYPHAGLAYMGDTRLPMAHYSHSSPVAPSPDTRPDAGIPPRYTKARPPAVRNTGTRGSRTDEELRATRMEVPGRAQDWGSVSDSSDTEATEMLPPEYRQAVERFAHRNNR